MSSQRVRQVACTCPQCAYKVKAKYFNSSKTAFMGAHGGPRTRSQAMRQRETTAAITAIRDTTACGTYTIRDPWLVRRAGRQEREVY